MNQGISLKFICDEQLGRLARWLRILGQDVVYQNQVSDSQIIEQAKKESRMVLTRDHNLAEKLFQEGIKYYLVEENYPAHQLREVVERFQSQLQLRVFSRCVECNLPLEEIEKAKVKNLVPPFVFQTQEVFRRCPGCGKIFWSATHRQQVDLQLRDILGDLYDRLLEEVWNPSPPIKEKSTG
ncbi:hypothetical protein DRN86_05765 [Candidatus Geothermarchaeota archaeon]|nr:MAG: hypothetical protein DRN86_05765 [Candidatus Geothermarchaeota archaeon]